MDIEAIIWIYLPIIISIIEVVWSLRLTFQKSSYFDSITSFLVLVLNGHSAYILIVILRGAWPSYIPYIAIGISTIILVIQILRRKRKKAYENISSEG